MICQNCRTDVDDDLIFCTNCGERLIHSQNKAQTVLINDPAATKSTVNSPLPKPSSNLKWVALIIALIAIPASIFGVYLLMRQNRSQVSQNINKPNTPVSTPTRANAKQNSNANIANTNVNSANANANSNSTKPANKNEIMNERIEIAPKTHYALPFEIEKENVKLIGEAKLLEGEKITGFVYLQKNYDEYFPDTTYKMFSFEGRKSVEINAPLVEEEYVLIFVNETDKPMIIQGNFSLK